MNGYGDEYACVYGKHGRDLGHVSQISLDVEYVQDMPR